MLLMFFPICTSAQLSGLLEIGIGMQGNDPIYDYGYGIGHTFKDNRTFVYGGMKMQKHSIVPPNKLRNSEIEYFGQTTSTVNFSMLVGGRYSVTLIKFKNDASFERMGFYPECRVLFSPLLPYKFSYENMEGETVNLKGDKISQFAYGLGGSLFIGSLNEGYFAVKFEVNTSDIIESLRNFDGLVGTHNFSDGPQYLVSVSFYLR